MVRHDADAAAGASQTQDALGGVVDALPDLPGEAGPQLVAVLVEGAGLHPEFPGRGFVEDVAVVAHQATQGSVISDAALGGAGQDVTLATGPGQQVCDRADQRLA
ncbi:hypothetical protein D3C72_614320 [compost metagenome]